MSEESDVTLYPNLIGKVIAEVKVEAIWTEAEDYDRMTITFTDGTKQEWCSGDSSGYQSSINDGPTRDMSPVVEAFREKVCPVPEFPGTGKEKA